MCIPQGCPHSHWGLSSYLHQIEGTIEPLDQDTTEIQITVMATAIIVKTITDVKATREMMSHEQKTIYLMTNYLNTCAQPQPSNELITQRLGTTQITALDVGKQDITHRIVMRTMSRHIQDI